MKNKIIISILGFLIILVSLNGCVDFLFDDDSENKKIPVKVIPSALVYNASGGPVPGVEIQFDLSKTYGQDFRPYRTTDEQGYASVNQYSYNLRKGEVITATCKVTQHMMIDEKIASYDQFLPDMETHTTTAWYDHFEFTLDL